MVPILLGVEWYAEPAEQPADRTTLQRDDRVWVLRILSS
jgi:hypothetical protein